MSDPDAVMERLRWPEGVRCLYCGSVDVGGPAARRRCRACRRRFCWSTGTALHSTKLPASTWIAAAGAESVDAAAVASATGVSRPTARRMAGLIGSAPAPADGTPRERLRALLGRPRPVPRSRKATTPPPAGPDAAGRAIAESLTVSERKVVNALRHRPFGTIIREVAALSGVSLGHTRRCLRRLSGLGVARRQREHRPWGYGVVEVPLWSLTYHGDCAHMLGSLPMTPTEPRPDRYPDMVPPRFWSCFWSSPANELTISRDGLFIAETLLTGPDQLAALWALTALPVDALRECRKLRGCDTGAIAADIDAFIRIRERAADDAENDDGEALLRPLSNTDATPTVGPGQPDPTQTAETSPPDRRTGPSGPAVLPPSLGSPARSRGHLRPLIEKALKQHPRRSHKQIAEQCGASVGYVRAVARKMRGTAGR